MHMDVRDSLPSLRPVLHADCEAAVRRLPVCPFTRSREVLSGQEPLGELDRAEQVGCLGWGEVREAEMRLNGADECMAREQRLEIDQSEAVLRLQEHLRLQL